MIKVISKLGALVGVALVVFIGCTSSEKSPPPPAFSVPPEGIERIWARKLPGLIADLNISRDGSAVLASVIPDPEQESIPGHYATLKFDPAGKELWKRVSEFRIKAQAISDDGKVVVLTDYNDELHLVNASGHTVWSVPGSCRPLIFSSTKTILCYRDDDVTPGVAFDLFDFEGKRIRSQSASADVLALKNGGDRNVVFGTSGGFLSMLAPDYSIAWTKHLRGEILDVAISEGESPMVAVLTQVSREGQMLAVYNAKGEPWGEIRPTLHIEQIEITPDGAAVAGYGNGTEGQSLTIFEVNATKKTLNSKWSRSVKRTADYAASLMTTPKSAVIGVIDFNPGVKLGELVSYAFDGAIQWRIPLVTEESAYLYARSPQDATQLIAVGTDDATLSAYRTKNK